MIDADIAQVWASAAARSEALYQRRQGEADLLLVRGVSAGYDERLVLHEVDLDVKEGEIVALLGTNGAGKSTLLKAISGVVEAEPRRGRSSTGATSRTRRRTRSPRSGISQMPGGQGVFGSLTVAENLQLAAWTRRRDPADVARRDGGGARAVPGAAASGPTSPAADLSGGQQQMVALAMAFIARPKVLLIDELSLGLAPVIVAQLLPIVRRLADAGVAVILVEQSVNVALTVAERAYFMERGRIQFSGPTAELLDRPDLLRSVFLSNASVGEPHAATRPTERRRRTPGRGGAVPALRVGERVVLVRRDPRRRRRVVRRRRARDRRASSVRTAPARRRCSTSSAASRRCSAARSLLGEPRRHVARAGGPCRGTDSGAASRTRGCSPT